MVSTRRLAAVGVLGWAAAWMVIGCAPLQTTVGTKSLLPAPRMSPDTVVLEVAVLDLPPEEVADEQLWRDVDEQQLPPALRRELAASGVRCGVLGKQLPERLKRRLEAQQKEIELENRDGASVVSGVPTQQRLQCRANRKRTIDLGPPREKLSLAGAGDDESEPKTWTAAQCGLALIAVPKGDGRVSLEMTPEIQHGKPRHRWIGDQGSFRLDSSRDCETFDKLRTELTLAPGQILLVAGTASSGGVGQAFFSNGEKDARRKLVLVRLAQTQLDDLFAPAPAAPPIATLGQ